MAASRVLYHPRHEQAATPDKAPCLAGSMQAYMLCRQQITERLWSLATQAIVPTVFCTLCNAGAPAVEAAQPTISSPPMISLKSLLSPLDRTQLSSLLGGSHGRTPGHRKLGQASCECSPPTSGQRAQPAGSSGSGSRLLVTAASMATTPMSQLGFLGSLQVCSAPSGNSLPSGILMHAAPVPADGSSSAPAATSQAWLQTQPQRHVTKGMPGATVPGAPAATAAALLCPVAAVRLKLCLPLTQAGIADLLRLMDGSMIHLLSSAVVRTGLVPQLADGVGSVPAPVKPTATRKRKAPSSATMLRKRRATKASALAAAAAAGSGSDGAQVGKTGTAASGTATNGISSGPCAAGEYSRQVLVDPEQTRATMMRAAEHFSAQQCGQLLHLCAQLERAHSLFLQYLQSFSQLAQVSMLMGLRGHSACLPRAVILTRFASAVLKMAEAFHVPAMCAALSGGTNQHSQVCS